MTETATIKIIFKFITTIKVLFYYHTTSYCTIVKKTKKFFVQTFAAISTPLSRSQLPLLALAKTFQCQ
jgi:hypothetical protein